MDSYIWVNRKDGSRYKKYLAKCILCGADRGYQDKKALDRMCVACKNKQPIQQITKEKISKSKIGHKKTSEQIEKSALYHRGKVVSNGTKNLLSTAFKSNKNPGGAAKGSKKSPEWRTKVKKTHADKLGLSIEEHDLLIKAKNDRRDFKQSGLTSACYERDKFTCQKCGATGGRLNAHHINSWKFFPEQRLALDNLITLCVNCHKIFHKIYGSGNELPNTKKQIQDFIK